MNATAQRTDIGTAETGGFYAGRILIANVAYALIVAPKAEGEHKDTICNRSQKMVEKATSWNDGMSNTLAMAEAGSKLAKWALDLRIGGFSDWYLGAVDELEICYRAFKPGAEKNSLWNRSGINVSSIPPTYPYSRDFPAQTDNELFRAGGAEAFDEVVYWSSTQHPDTSSRASVQFFDNGDQYYDFKGNGSSRARAVRRIKI